MDAGTQADSEAKAWALQMALKYKSLPAIVDELFFRDKNVSVQQRTGVSTRKSLAKSKNMIK